MVRGILLAGLVMLALPGFAPAQAPAFPTKPIRLVIPFPAGGFLDTVGRQLSARFQEGLGQPLLIENRAGANTIIGAEAVARAPGDGYTLGLVSSSTLSLNPHLYAKLPYDAARDFAYVTNVAWATQAVFVHPSVAATTMSELVAFAKANPGKLNYASFGLGSQPHLAVEWLKSRVGIDMVHVPYNGTAPAMTAFLAGQVQVYYGTIGPAVPHARAGKIRPLAVVGTDRTPQLPDVPSFKEAGYTDIDMRVWFGIVAPASTPRDLVVRLGDFIATTVRSPAFREQVLLPLGLDPIGDSPAAFAEFARRDREAAAPIVKVSGARLD